MANLRPKVLTANGTEKLLGDLDNLVVPHAPQGDAHATNKKYTDDADAALQASIDAEEAARIAADNTLQANIDAEEAARIAADQGLQQAIDDEEAARIAADTALQGQIDSIESGDNGLPAYVKKAGDNMSGPLTLGVTKIVLSHDTGDGTFFGKLEAASVDGGTY